ncbi:unnamed protein product [Fusarium graminearum]|uniref:Chromosome 2, complete genome n=1 Tax=Gibberella zeae (strain ATCC MYA-4620 / CBS 123657 / FGSC 9075 / NRRL 31084 / PH-1) TaxID=229533 RepID=A0A098DDH8_GIBZE|nr:unnamed protein product [Fusarium graminearum]CZS80321.1 unnamed protein product [Fusarium graminearum]
MASPIYKPTSVENPQANVPVSYPTPVSFVPVQDTRTRLLKVYLNCRSTCLKREKRHTTTAVNKQQ